MPISAPRMALSIITMFIIIAVIIICQVVVAPMIESWSNIALSAGVIDAGLNSVIIAVFRASVFIVGGGALIWCVINSFASENENPYLDEFGRFG